MKLFRIPSVTTCLAAAALLAVLSTPALADKRHDRDRGYRDWNHNSSWNRHGSVRNKAYRPYQSNFRSNVRTGHRRDNVTVNVNVGRGYSGWNNGWNNRYRNARPYNRHVNSRYYSRYYGPRYGYYNDSGFVTGLAAGTLLTTAITAYSHSSHAHDQTTVVYKQPTVVHVKESSSGSGRLVSGSANRSLLRDIHGNCYERSYDSRGVETRIELPVSACNF